MTLPSGLRANFDGHLANPCGLLAPYCVGGAVLTNAPGSTRTFNGLVLANQIFDDFQDFSGSVFEGPVDARGARFNAGFSFDRAVFKDRVRFEGAIVRPQKGNSARFHGARFEDVARFNRALLYLAVFQDAVFDKFAEFRWARFYGSAQFGAVKFGEASSFADTVFQGPGNFNGASFARQVDFRKARFRNRGSHARFAKAKFLAPALFDEAQFGGHAEFNEAKFYGGASFAKSVFGFAVNNNGEDEDELADPDRNEATDADLRIAFQGSEFRDGPTGEVAVFDEARFGDLNFRRHANFDDTKFTRTTPANPSHLPRAHFKELKCNGGLSMRHAHFGGVIEVDFAGSRFEDDVDISEAQFGKDAIFEKCQFKQSLSVAGTRFYGYPDFRNVSFKHYPNLFECSLPTRLASYRRRERPLIAARIGTLRRIAARTDDEKTELRLLVHELKLKGGFASKLYGIVSNYGQSWLRPALWLLFFALVVFPVLQLTVNGRLPSTSDQLQWLVNSERSTCAAGEGNIFAAAVEISVKNAMIVGSENETRSKRVLECLGAIVPPGHRTVSGTLLEALQAVLSVVFAFFIGAAVRRRLQLR